MQAGSRSSTSPTRRRFGLLPPCADPGFDHHRRLLGGRRPRLESDPPRPARASDRERREAPTPEPRRRAPTRSRRARERSANPFAPSGGVDPIRSWRRRRGGRQPVRAHAAPRGRPSAVAHLGSSVCWAAGWPSSAAMPRSCSRTTARRTRSSGRCRRYPGRADARAVSGPPGPAAGRHHVHRDDPSGPGRGLARALVDAVCDDLAGAGSPPSRPTRKWARPDATSAATPGFWETVGFAVAAPDDPLPVMRRELVTALPATRVAPRRPRGDGVRAESRPAIPNPGARARPAHPDRRAGRRDAGASPVVDPSLLDLLPPDVNGVPLDPTLERPPRSPPMLDRLLVSSGLAVGLPADRDRYGADYVVVTSSRLSPGRLR